MSLSDDILAPGFTALSKVREGPELRRILALPRATPPAPHNLPEGLRPIQRRALATYLDRGGLVLLAGVGAGKSLVAGHLATFAKRPLVLSTPAGVRALKADLKKHGLEAPPVQTYNRVAHPKHPHLLQEAAPDLIIADEASALMSARSIGHKRVRAYLRAHPETHFAALTATGINRSVRDLAWIFEWALGDQSPLPRPSIAWGELQEWAEALDPGTQVKRPLGALRAFGKPVVKAVGDWIRASPGVVATQGHSTEVPLSVTEVDWPCPIPGPIADALDALEAYWQDPDGRPILTAIDYTRTRQHLLLGGFYRSDEDPEARVDRLEWQARLQALVRGSRKFDSPARLLAHVPDAMPPRPPDPAPSEWIEIDLAPVHRAVEWARRAPGVVWSGIPDQGRAIARLAGIPYHGAGESAGLAAETGARSCVASYQAHGKGLNLQAFHRALVLGGPTSAAAWTQLLGRHHRAGQKKPVIFEVYAGQLPKARKHARWLEKISGEKHRLL